MSNENNIIININLNGGDYPEGFTLPIKVAKGKPFSLEKPRKTGFTFSGWKIGRKIYNFIGKDDINEIKLLTYEINILRKILTEFEKNTITKDTLNDLLTKINKSTVNDLNDFDFSIISNEILIREERITKIKEEQDTFEKTVKELSKNIKNEKKKIEQDESLIRKHGIKKARILQEIAELDSQLENLGIENSDKKEKLESKKEELLEKAKLEKSFPDENYIAKDDLLKLAKLEKELDEKERKLDRIKRANSKTKQIIVPYLTSEKNLVAEAIWKRRESDLPRILEFREHKKGEQILKVRNLHISFKTPEGKLQAVRGVDFELFKGETLAIVGESGSGKSVTTRAVMGILAGNAIYDKGAIYYHGYDMMHFKESHYAQVRGSRVSMIFQDPMSSLNPIMKVGRQIAESLVFKQGMKWSDAKERAIELMELVGIPEARLRYNQYPFQFSGGMRQRIVIAIALANNAEILIADEPTTALDVTIQAQILELLDNIIKELDLSVIFITHDLGVVANVADRVVVMYAGRVVEYGLVDEIFYNAKHPYTWALLSSMPTLSQDKERLEAIPGTPPNMVNPPKGDAFAPRNRYALAIDSIKHPPFFKVSDTHYAATWLLDERSPKITPPKVIRDLHKKWQTMQKEKKESKK